MSKTKPVPIELNDEIEKLYDWRPPQQLQQALTLINKRYTSAELFTYPNINRLFREIWGTYEFCRLAPSEEARLIRDDQINADFSCKLAGRMLNLQLTEAIEEGRIRGREYQLGPKLQHDPFEDWGNRRRQIPDRLRETFAKKARKGYPPDVSLLVYLNIVTYDYWREEIEADIFGVSNETERPFASIWIIWSGRLYRTYLHPDTENWEWHGSSK